MRTFNSYNEMAVANGSVPYIPLQLRDAACTENMETDNMSPRFMHVPMLGSYYFGCWANEECRGGKIEPPHVHVFQKRNEVARLWLDDERTGNVSVDPHKSKGVPAHVLQEFVKHVQEHREHAFADWDARMKESNYQSQMNPKELEKFNEREQKRGNPPYVPVQQKQGKESRK